MKKILLTLFCTLLMLSCKQEAKSVKIDVNYKPVKDSLTLEIRNLAQNYFNGLAVAIVDSTGVLYEKGIGFADVKSNKFYTANTIQPIASVSKTFIGIALMKAQEEGLLNLDDSVNEYLPFEIKNPNFPNQNITIRQLATHTSSIIDNDYYMNKSYVLKDKIDSTLHKAENIPQSFRPKETFIPMSQFLENYLSSEGKWYNTNAFSANKPGQLFEYTNVGATLAAYIIEIASKQSYSEFTTKHILKPLKMNNSGWNYNEVNFKNVSTLYSSLDTELPYYSLITYPDGGFITSANDLGKYLTELINGYSGHGTLLTKDSYNELFKTQLKDYNFEERIADNPYNDEYNSGVFMGFSAMNNIGHTGGDPGVSSLMFFNATDKIGRILIVNTDIDSQDGFNAYFDIFNKLGEFAPKLK